MKTYQHSQASSTVWLPYLIFILAAIPLLLLRDFTPDNELRYLSIADEALANGQLFAFTNHGIPYADKPPLYLWIVMLCRKIFGEHLMIAIGAVSLIPALITGLVMDNWTKRYLSPDLRTAALWMLFSTAYFFGLSVTLRMDMLMTLFIILALRSFYLYYKYPEVEHRQKILFPLWVFMAIFTKGPLGILIPLISTLFYLIWEKKLRMAGRLWGWRTWLILILLCCAWFAGVALDGGKDYLNNLLVHQTVDRAVNAFHHQRPFYYYGIAFWYVAAPWSLFLAASILRRSAAGGKWSDIERLFASVIICSLILLSAISSKVQVYLLPVLPVFIYLGALCLNRNGASWIEKALLFIVLLPLALLLPAGIALRYLNIPELMPIRNFIADTGIPDKALIFGSCGIAVLSVCAIVSLVYLFKRHHIAKSAAWLGFGVLAAVGICGFATDSLNPAIGYGAMARKADSTATPDAHIYTWRIRRAENIDVYMSPGRRITVLPDDTIPFAHTSPTAGDLLIVPESNLSDIGFEATSPVKEGSFIIITIKNK